MSSYKRNRIRKPLTAETVRLRLSQAIQEAEKVLLTTDNENTKLQAVYALSNASKAYVKVMENILMLNNVAERLARSNKPDVDQWDLNKLSVAELKSLRQLYLKATGQEEKAQELLNE